MICHDSFFGGKQATMEEEHPQDVILYAPKNESAGT